MRQNYIPLCFCRDFWVDCSTDSWNCWANSSAVKLSQGLTLPLRLAGPSLGGRADRNRM